MKNLTPLVAGLSLLLCLGFLSPNPLKSQDLMGDSLTLVDLYNSTNGPHWIDNAGWLTTAPVSSWFGVFVLDGRVFEVNLDGNNLQGVIPDISNMDVLSILKVRDNFITDLPVMPSIGETGSMEEFDCSFNLLEFDDIETVFGNGIGNLLYDPQKEYGVEEFFFREPGDEVTFSCPAGGTDNLYQWFYQGMAITSPGPESTLTLSSVTIEDAGAYFCQVTSTSIPFLVLNSKPKNLTVGACEDSLGGSYKCQEMIIRFKPGTPQLVKDSLRMEYGATVIDSCRCNFLEIWDIPDSLGLEETVGLASKKADVEETGFNYEITIGPAFDQFDPPAVPPSFFGNPPGPDNVPVAIIDSGIDWSHSQLFDRMWTNAPEWPLNTFDDDGNCLNDDYQGYDFANDSIHPIDIHGHGTHIAGIVVDGTPPEIEVMNLKAFNTNGSGSIFDATCAVYYAIDKGAKVINMSWGYYGVPSDILESAIEEAANSCGALVVTSAGNTSNDNDNTVHHYPSDYTLDNVIAVAALDLPEVNLASFTNFGMVSVDIAAPGTQILSTVPGDATAIRSGSSMAAGFVSKAAAQMYNTIPGVTYRGVKNCLFNSVNLIPGGADSLSTGGQLVETAAISCVNNDPYVFECDPLIDLKIMLEGPYDSGTGLMTDNYRTGGHIPTNQPYNISPWNYAGPEFVESSLLFASGSFAIVDWVLVAHIDTSGVDTLITYQAGLVRADGTVIDGFGGFLRPPVNKPGFIAVFHRNHLAIMSTDEIVLDQQPTTINFIDGTIPAIGGPFAMNSNAGVNLMISGDANRDGVVNTVDKNLEWALQNGTAFDYFLSTADFNFDAFINAVDKNLYYSPNNSKQSQCPYCY
ncbi:MAG: S8 family serine peptidase [Bacteroidota bacterium]